MKEAWPRSEDWLGQDPSPFAGEDNRPLLIGACPRSGTTLLRSMLNNHPDLAVPPETDFVLPLWANRTRYGDLRDSGNRRRLAEWIFDTPGKGGQRIRAGVFEREQAIERVMEAPPTLGSVLTTLFEMFAEAKGKRRWGDKRPRYAWYVAELFELFPNAQFINVVRDPRAAVASALPIGWGGPELVLPLAILRWQTSIDRVDTAARRLRRDQLLDVRYEDLVRDPHAVLERICEFAGLRGGDAIDEMVTGERRGVYRDGWHTRLSEPVTTARVESWRETLKAHEIALVEHVTGPYLERFGYERTSEAAPDRAELRKLRRLRVRQGLKWRRYALGELKRKLLYRHPVAAT